MLRSPLFGLLVAFAVAVSDHVVKLCKSNVDMFLASEDVVLIDPYASWYRHCKVLGECVEI
ncbi:hypothetical protein BX666DRAFT_1946719 [Dichotomocladium elegans]|nr:hypothetical protein BX666DRAFT_1946719 [Dichotomocladium elegans]